MRLTFTVLARLSWSFCFWRRFLRRWRRCPNLHRPIQAGRGDPLAALAEGHRLDPARVAAQDVRLRTGAVPDLDGAVGTAPGQAPVVRAEGHALDRTFGRVVNFVEELPVGGVPDFDRPVPTGRRQQFPIPAEVHIDYPRLVSGFKDF